MVDNGQGGGPPAILIAGPTASGKSALAVRLAELLGAEVVNADSMQVYRDLHLLTARPTQAEEKWVAHHLFGFVDGDTAFSAGDYVRAVAGLPGRGLRIFVGGTGLYFKALTQGLVETPPVPVQILRAIAGRAAAGEDLHAALHQVDPDAAARLAPADRPRIERALAVFEATGRTLADWQRETQAEPLLRPGRWFGIFLSPDRDVLYPRIDSRFETMVAQGALEEVRELMHRNLASNRGVMKAHGVPHLIRHLNGEMPLSEAIRLGQLDTRHYAKRQLTWARKFMRDWSWHDEADGACSAALDWCRQSLS